VRIARSALVESSLRRRRAGVNAREHTRGEHFGARAPPRAGRWSYRLEALLADQGYRLSHWRVAADEINYRRSFDVDELAAVRVEEPAVFEAMHELPLRLAREGVVCGFRIDHVDGLLEPADYLRRLPGEAYVALLESVG